jgi:hypothetical protein
MMIKRKFISQPKKEDVFLAILSLKFREAGYQLTVDSDSKKEEENSDSLFTITPINADDAWCFNVCKSGRY